MEELSGIHWCYDRDCSRDYPMAEILPGPNYKWRGRKDKVIDRLNRPLLVTGIEKPYGMDGHFFRKSGRWKEPMLFHSRPGR